MDSGNEESENDNSGIVDDEEDYEQLGSDQSLLKHKHPRSMTIHTVSVDTTTEMAHSPSQSGVSEEEHEKN
jgi:hypothetical protein